MLVLSSPKALFTPDGWGAAFRRYLRRNLCLGCGGLEDSQCLSGCPTILVSGLWENLLWGVLLGVCFPLMVARTALAFLGILVSVTICLLLGLVGVEAEIR